MKRKAFSIILAFIMLLALLPPLLPTYEALAGGRADGAGMTIAAGNSHTIALRNDGTVWTCAQLL